MKCTPVPMCGTVHATTLPSAMCVPSHQRPANRFFLAISGDDAESHGRQDCCMMHPLVGWMNTRHRNLSTFVTDAAPTGHQHGPPLSRVLV